MKILEEQPKFQERIKGMTEDEIKVLLIIHQHE